MEAPPTGPGSTLIMTRAGAIGIAVGLVCVSFPAGWFVSRITTDKAIAAAVSSVEADHADHVKFLRENPSYPSFTGPDGKWIEPEKGLADFEPSPGDSVTWSRVGGIDTRDWHVTISGDGVVTIADQSGPKEVTRLTAEQTVEFFKKIISGGLAAYSEEAVCLKALLRDPESGLLACFAPTTKVEIRIEKLKVDRRFELYCPEMELIRYPDIIEFRSIVEIEKEILGFVP